MPNIKLDVVLECPSNDGVCSAISAGMGVSLIGERLIRSDMEVLDSGFTRPPGIAFVIRTASTRQTSQLSALQGEIKNSLT